MSASGQPIRNIWILLRAAGATRRFIKVQISGTDGSVYLALGDPHRNVRIAEVTMTIPPGETSVDVDYTKHVVRTYENFDGAHVGLKASGRVIEKFGTRYYSTRLDVPPSAARDILVQTIYPARLDILPEKSPRGQDLVLPDRFEYRTRAGTEMETVFGPDPFHVDVWQMAAGSTEGVAAPTVVGTCSMKAGERQFVFAFVQDDIDRRRGWLPGGTRVLRPVAPHSV